MKNNIYVATKKITHMTVLAGSCMENLHSVTHHLFFVVFFGGGRGESMRFMFVFFF